MRRRRLLGLVLLAPLAGPAPALGARQRVGPREEPRFTQVVDGLRQGLREQGLGADAVELLLRANRVLE